MASISDFLASPLLGTFFGGVEVAQGGRDSWRRVEQLAQTLAEADAVVVGAGAGLSTAAGFTYSGERFSRYFAEFEEAYGFHDMYSGGFYPFDSLEAYWGYWSRFIYVNRYMDAPKPVYQQLIDLIREKDHFVITTNVDHCFQKAGVDKHRLFYTQGDYGLWQCSEPCHAKTYDNEAQVRRMVDECVDLRIPTELVPHCPVCGKPMTMNLRADATFVEDDGWERAANRYQDFVRRHSCGRVLYLELGVGGNTPGIIKYPFWRMTAANPKATYACVNLGEAFAPRELGRQSICIDADIADVVEALSSVVCGV